MQEDLINTLSEQFKNQYQPWAQLSSFWINNLEKITDFQLSTINTYSKLGLEQMKKAIAIKDMDDLQDFASAQTSAAETLNKQLVEDGKVLTEITQDFFSNVESIWQQSLSSNEITPTEKKKSKAA
jgi:phasin family protein